MGHFREAGDTQKAVDYSIRAGEDAQAVFATKKLSCTGAPRWFDARTVPRTDVACPRLQRAATAGCLFFLFQAEPRRVEWAEITNRIVTR